MEYSRNLLFASGAVMDRVFDTVVDRTRCRLDVPKLRTLFGTKGRPHRRPGVELSPRQAVVIERPRWNLTIFKVHFGLLTLKAYTKGEHVLRFEAIVHAGLRPGAGAFPGDRHPPRRDGRRFTTMLDCLDIGYIPDGILDQLPAPSQIGATRVGGVDVNKTRIRAALPPCSRRQSRPPASPSPGSPPRCTPSPGKPKATTPLGKAPTTCASCAASSSSPNPAEPAMISPADFTVTLLGRRRYISTASAPRGRRPGGRGAARQGSVLLSLPLDRHVGNPHPGRKQALVEAATLLRLPESLR